MSARLTGEPPAVARSAYLPEIHYEGGAGCWWFSKKFKTCKQVMFGVSGYIFSYIKDKCEAAQN